MPLEIKVSHRYRTRSGDVVEIIGDNYSDTHPYLGRFINRQYTTSFTAGGGWLIGEESENDLIEELPADVDLLEGKPK